MESRNPSVRSLVIASLVTLILSLLPFAKVITYPFLIFSTFIHESSHALAAVLTSGDVKSLTIHWDGSGTTYTRGGISAVIASAGYVGTALFGGLLLVLSRNERYVRPALAGCAILIAFITASFVGHTNNLLVLLAFFLISLFLLLSFCAATATKRWGMLGGAGGFLILLLIYLVVTRSLFSWAVGLLMTVGLLAVLQFASLPFAHFFLSFLAVQCSLNAIEAIKVLYFISVRTAGHTDAQTMAALTGMPAWVWALLWALQAVAILIFSFWIYSARNRPEVSKSF